MKTFISNRYNFNRLSASNFRSTILVVVLALLSHASFAQLSGSTTVLVGDNINYSYNDNEIFFSGTISWTISPAIGTVNSSSVSANKWTVYSNITWHTAGTATLSIKRGTTTLLTFPVTVSCALNPTFTQPGNVCFPANVSINASPGSGGNSVRWYDASSGGNLLSTGTNYTPYVTTTTTYYIATYNTSSGCETSTRVPITVSGNQKPAVPSVTPAARCGHGTVTLTGSVGSGGDQVKWSYEGSGTLYTGTSYTTPILASTTLYYATSYNSSTGCYSADVDVWATVNPVPSAPSTTPGAICGPGNVTLSASPGVNGNSIRWYNSGGGGVQSSNTSYAPSVSSTTTYYASTYNTTTGCESGGQAVVATVNPIPSLPNATPGGTCGPGSVTLSASPGANGNSVRWYNTGGGAVQGTNSTYNTPSVSSTTTFYVSTYNTTTTCESSNQSVLAVVKTIPSAPSTTPGAVCGSGSVTLSATPGANGDLVRWYNVGGGAVQSTNSTYSPSVSSTTTFYVSTYSTDTNCESSNQSVVATVNPVPSAPSTTPGAICGPGNVTLSASPGADGNSIRWYNIGGGSVQSSNTTYAPYVTAPSTTFYATTYNTSTGCESGTTNAVATVNPLPSAPSFTGSPLVFCGSSVVNITATAGSGGSQVKWYTVPANGTAFQSTLTYSPNITTSTSYYLSTLNSTTLCESSTRTTVSITSNTIPLAASVTNGTRCGEGPVTLSANPGLGGNGVRWYETSDGTNLLSSSSTFEPSVQSSSTYYVQSIDAGTGCVSTTMTPVTATAYDVPMVPLSGFQQFVYGSGQGVIATVDRNVNTTVQWSESAASNATVIQTGLTYTTPTLTANKDYYVQAVNSTTTCKSEKGIIKMIVEPVSVLSDIKSEVVRKKDIKTETQVDALVLATGEKSISRTFFDGLGRTLQSVIQQASPLGKDVIQPMEYDVFGRASKNYLPYVVNSTSGNFRSAYVTEQSSFYTASSDKIANDTQPYSLALFEASPLARVTEQGSVGQAWQPGSNHTNRVSYGWNTGATGNALEEVRNLYSDGTSSSFYAANTLARTEGTDADGNKVVTFTNGSGQVLVKKQQLDEVIDGVTVNWLETYYVYDDFGRVKFMISPKGTVALKSGSWSLTQTIKDNYCHQFVYDVRGRLIEKKVPGQAWMFYAYDKLDRLVLTQDGMLRTTNQWMFIKYDQRGRAVMQGLYTNATETTRASIQTIADGLYVAGNATYPENAWYETVGSTLEGYSNTSFPKTNKDNSALTVLSVNYFDSYDFDNNGSPDYSYTSQGLASEGSATSNVVGMPTRSKRKVLGTSTWLETIVFYDQYGRAIQTKSNNHLNTSLNNLSTVVYDFEGKTLSVKSNHNAGPGKEIITKQSPVYDVGGRVTAVDYETTAAEGITWTSLVNMTVNGTDLVRGNTSPGTWTAGAFSVEKIPAAQDGWIEFTIPTGMPANPYIMVGLSDANTDASYTSIDYAIYAYNGSGLRVYENGVYIGPFGTFTANDVFRIERTGTTIKYLKNNVVFYTSLTASTTDLFVDCAAYSAGVIARNVSMKKNRTTRAAEYTYNELGQLVDKKLHVNGGNYLQSIDYRYSIRGQLESINNARLTNDGDKNDDTGDYFGMEFLYNTVESGLNNKALYNGNISAVTWKGAGVNSGDNDRKSYKYSYDKSNKLDSATSQIFFGSAWTKEANALNEIMTYDHNGNIKSLKRNQRKHQLNGVIASYTSETADDLTYTYNSTVGDQLQKVTDASANIGGFDNGSSGTSNDYTYDVQGNVTADLNKGISSVVYNELGKAKQINFTDGRKIDYVFDAAGTKLTMKTWQGTTLLTTTDYVNGFVYENNNLSFFGSPEGRVVKNGGALEYQYSIADHQGNTRVVFTSATPTPDVPETGFESTPNSVFQNADANRSSQSVMNHTAGGTYSQLLNGGNNSQIGATKTLKVYPGDKIKAEVFSKYRNASGSAGNITAFAGALASAFGVNASSTGEMQNVYQGMNNFGGFVADGNRPDDDASPKGFVTIMIFDKNHNFLDAAWDQLDEAYNQGTDIVNNLPFDTLTQEVTIKQEGFVYIFVSNEHPTQIDIHFDDLKVTHTKSNVIQYNEYYPFGLQASTSWTRENNKNDFLYNAGSELNQTSGWYETFFRGYNAAIGRFLQVDPLAANYSSFTPYQYAANNPVMFNDPNGDKVYMEDGMLVGTAEWMAMRARMVNMEMEGMTRMGHSGSGEGRFGSANYWTHGMGRSDWSADGGSESYQLERAFSNSVGGYERNGEFYDRDGNKIDSKNGAIWVAFTEVDYSTEKLPTQYSPQILASPTTGYRQIRFCSDCLNPYTLNRNLLDLSYPGGDNPMTFAGDYSYEYVPLKLSEYPAIGHDKRYDKLDIAGLSGLLTDPRAVTTDWRFVGEELALAFNPLPGDTIDKGRAFILGVGLGIGALSKTILNMISIEGSAQIIDGYFATQGVTNDPTKKR